MGKAVFLSNYVEKYKCLVKPSCIFGSCERQEYEMAFTASLFMYATTDLNFSAVPTLAFTSCGESLGQQRERWK